MECSILEQLGIITPCWNDDLDKALNAPTSSYYDGAHAQIV
jgi:hypothetical protein